MIGIVSHIFLRGQSTYEEESKAQLLQFIDGQFFFRKAHTFKLPDYRP
jgi:hypothetical protein